MDFTELKIAKGRGNFHVNQFRIHFSVPGLQGDPQKQLQLLVGEFIRDFPKFFNGNGKNMKVNRAAVAWTTKLFENKKTLRFLLDFKSEKLGVDLPDVHSDWVYVVWQSPGKGFAAQTLKRNFSEAADYLAGALPPPLGPIFSHLNSHHFLAGRRSWVFGVLAPGLPGWRSGGFNVGRMEGGKFVAYGGKPDPVFFLESSAVERYSLLLYELMEKDRGLFVDMRKAIVAIWCTLLENYVRSKGFRLNVGHPTTYQEDDGASLWTSQSIWRGVYYRQAGFMFPRDLYAKKWAQYLLDLHPGLKSQPLEESQFKGFGGGRFGGGGAGGSW